MHKSLGTRLVCLVTIKVHDYSNRWICNGGNEASRELLTCHILKI